MVLGARTESSVSVDPSLDFSHGCPYDLLPCDQGFLCLVVRGKGGAFSLTFLCSRWRALKNSCSPSLVIGGFQHG